MQPSGTRSYREDEENLILGASFSDSFGTHGYSHSDLLSNPYSILSPAARPSTLASGRFLHHASWHPLLGLTLYLLVLVACTAVLVASCTGLLHNAIPGCSEGGEAQILSGMEIVLLGFTAVIQAYLTLYQKWQLHNGYLRLSQRMGALLPLPFVFVSLGTGLLLSEYIWLSETDRLQRLRIGLAVQFSAVWCLAIGYSWSILQYQIWQPMPDVYKELESSLRRNDEGYGGHGLEEAEGGVMERQGVLIFYLREHLYQLSQEVLRLQEQLSQISVPGGVAMTSQVEAAQLAAVREQEQRAFAAECEQLQAEVLRTHGMLSEQQEEGARLRNLNHQFVEENARLRQSRDEWSHLNRKMEIALKHYARDVADLQLRLSLAEAAENVAPSPVQMLPGSSGTASRTPSPPSTG
eukprot:TRINITY_DN32811_c0_g1_i1.p1 TRINITY_DN32811_c0_g1~~TRINITY_DN32811_c0_g1_i1.p1  ORF type:complete len:409 (+),score=56.70 TRINITY_DN32811_c0_g1_i1:993-2219(+)